MDKLSYALGHNIGHQLIGMGLQESLNIDDYAAAIADVLQGRQPQMSHEEAHCVLENFFNDLEARQQAEAAERGKAARADGEAFLNKNKLRPEVTTTASGLQYEVLTAGTGRRPRATDTVRCHYEGTLIDGTVFDSSYKRGKPASFRCNQVIKGWTEALQLMPVGSTWMLYIPQELAYGSRETGGLIKPFSALIFKVELLGIEEGK